MSKTYRKVPEWRKRQEEGRKFTDKDMWPKGSKTIVTEGQLTGYSDEGGSRKDRTPRKKIRAQQKSQLSKELKDV